MRIAGICRFSLLGLGDWKAYQGKQASEVEAIAAEQAEKLFTDERMERRLLTFEHLTLASLRAQTDQNFTFIVLASEAMPKIYRERLTTLCETVSQVVLRFFPLTDVIKAQAHVFSELQLKYSNTIQFRLDDDDCVFEDFIALLRQSSSQFQNGSEPLAMSVGGAIYSKVDGQMSEVYDWPMAFLGAGAALWHPSKSVYAFGHFALGRRFRSVVIEDHRVLVTNNGTNDTSLTAAQMQKRGLIRLQPEQVQEAVVKDFDFLSSWARELAGLCAQGDCRI